MKIAVIISFVIVLSGCVTYKISNSSIEKHAVEFEVFGLKDSLIKEDILPLFDNVYRSKSDTANSIHVTYDSSRSTFKYAINVLKGDILYAQKIILHIKNIIQYNKISAGYLKISIVDKVDSISEIYYYSLGGVRGKFRKISFFTRFIFYYIIRE